jgi:dTDP-4-dehydrorhamnose 3,5-epimerase
MQVTAGPLPGLALVQLKVHGDARGFFVERFNEARFREAGAEAGLPLEYVQDNHSRSAPGVLRGLHYQNNPAQGKLVGVVRGRVWDVAVDIRPESPTYGQHFGVELSDVNGLLLWIPAGFAHGFCVLGDEPADMLYKVTSLYSPANEGGIRYDDPEFAIDWPITNPQVSPRDEVLPSFAEYRAQLGQ